MATLDLQTAQKMVEQYTVTRRTLINQTYGINDTKNIWFSLADVNAFIAGLTPDTSGVRIYLAAYADDDPTYPNQTTIIAIGTTTDASGANVDPMQLPANPTMLKVAADGGGGNDPANHGTLCPPQTNC
jgi:hypothetical protein